MGKNGEKFLLVNVAARRLGISESYVRRLIREDKLPADTKTGRNRKIPAAAVEAFRSGAGES